MNNLVYEVTTAGGAESRLNTMIQPGTKFVEDGIRDKVRLIFKTMSVVYEFQFCFTFMSDKILLVRFRTIPIISALSLLNCAG